ncbi:hypothetical protein [Sphingomonas sp. ERG5]|uniref:hypothetical protein n=1 Tax=Sphingomonas sp. ERG5 TaxID=1381597 RepID=UPI001364AD86|nr:hypothetical protein [Sphingomonas sp. ERG5]
MLADSLGGAPAPCVSRRRPPWVGPHKIDKMPVTITLNLLFSIPAALSPVTNGGAPCAF